MQHGVTRTLTIGGSESPTETHLNPSVQTLGKMLASAGYNVQYRGKFHLTNPLKVRNHSPGMLRRWVSMAGSQPQWPTMPHSRILLAVVQIGIASPRIRQQASWRLKAIPPQQNPPLPWWVGLGNPHDVLAYPRSFDAVDDETNCNNYADFDFERGISLPQRSMKHWEPSQRVRAILSTSTQWG